MAMLQATESPWAVREGYTEQNEQARQHQEPTQSTQKGKHETTATNSAVHANQSCIHTSIRVQVENAFDTFVSFLVLFKIRCVG